MRLSGMWARVTAGALGLALLGGAATAATYTATEEGSVIFGVDGDGYFGPAGGDLSGVPFKAVVTFDPSLATVFLEDATREYVFGGITSAKLTLEGVVYDFTPIIATGNNDITYGIGSPAEDDLQVSSHSGTTSLDLHFPPVFTRLTDTGSFSGSGFGGGFFINFDFMGHGSFGELGLETFSVTSSAVPEPSAWLAMTVGLLVVGARLRRSAFARSPTASA